MGAFAVLLTQQFCGAKVVKKIDIRKRLFLFIVKFVPKGTSYDPDLGNK